MAKSQLIVRPGSSKVIQGTRQQIAAELEKLDDKEELTLIVPGKEVKKNGDASPVRLKSFDEVFGPLQKGFEASGMTEEELDDFVDAEMKAYRAERRTKK